MIEQLEQIAPVTTVSGKVDSYGQSGFPYEAVIELTGCRIAIRHILYEGGKLTKEGRAFLQENQLDLCIFGHMHQPKVEWFGKTLVFNPGSAGPRRFNLPRELGILAIATDTIRPTHIPLVDKPNDSPKLREETPYIGPPVLLRPSQPLTQVFCCIWGYH